VTHRSPHVAATPPRRRQLALPGLLLGRVVAADTSVAEYVPASTQRNQPRPKQGKTPRFSEGLRH
jgi:hypothetical protein